MKRISILAFLWSMFFVRGLFYVAYLPLWEGFDEWAHYSVIQRIATGGRPLVRRDERVSREVQASLNLAPRRPGGADGELEFGAYWALPDAEREARQRALRSLSPQWATVPATDGAAIYEAQQAPLYYWLFAPLYALAVQAPFLTRVWLLRLCSLLIASLVVPLAFLVSREVLRCDLRAFSCAALVSAMPQLMMSVNHVGNDCLSIPMGALFLLALLRWQRQPHSLGAAAALGVTLGLALLTKAYFVALIPPVAFFAAVWAVRHRAYRQVLLVFTCAAAISCWWYIRTWMLTHSLSGEQIEIAGSQAATRGRMTLIAAFEGMHWRSTMDFALLSHIWLGNWSLLVVRSWIYHLYGVCAALATVGVALSLIRRAGRYPERRDVVLLVGIWASFLAALGYQAARNFQAGGFPGTMGYYLFPVLIAEAILVVVGLEQVAPRALKPAVVPGAVISFAAVEFFGINFYSIPYYTGMIIRWGSLPALSIHQLERGGLKREFSRLASNKPEFLGATMLALLCAMFIVATAGLIFFAMWVAVQRRTAKGEGGPNGV